MTSLGGGGLTAYWREELGEGFGIWDALAGGREDGVGEESFLLLQAMDAVLDGVGAEQFVHENRFGLTDAVGPVGGLCFGSGIPPGIVVNDGIGGGEVEPGPAGFEGNEKDGDVVVLKLFDEAASILGRPSEL